MNEFPSTPPAASEASEAERAEHPFGALREDVAQIAASGARYLEARRDQALVALRRALLAAVAMGLALLAIATTVAVGVAQIWLGLAGLLAQSLRLPAWAGQLIVGASLLAAIFLALRWTSAHIRRQLLEHLTQHAHQPVE